MTKTFAARLTKPRLMYRLWRKLLSFFFIEQWIILLSKNTDHDHPIWSDFKPLLPPPDRDWADPFLWKHDGRYYIFIEEKPFSAKNAHITCLTLDNEMNIVSSQIVLTRPYHLSYPFLFTHNDQLFMMPETIGNHAIELYRCMHFPDQWEFSKTLIPNINAVDATLTNLNNTWWLFANVEDKDGSTWNTLCLYSANSPVSGSWQPHPKNPIVKDVQFARPAGNILSIDGKLIRPSQDCSRRYGYATNFMRISTLSETDYAEVPEHTFKPPVLRNILGIHTWNELDGITVIDATLRRKKTSAVK